MKKKIEFLINSVDEKRFFLLTYSLYVAKKYKKNEAMKPRRRMATRFWNEVKVDF